MRGIWWQAALLLVAACGNGDRLTQERLACLGETPAAGCKAIYERDLGVTIPAGSGSANPPATAAVTAPAQRSRPAGPAICSLSGQSYPVGASTRHEVTADIRGVGMVHPRPGDGRPRQETCTCQARPGGGAAWSCR